jgi:tRNA C32,U32 (ribose-2'-O)-methylase TrmJ
MGNESNGISKTLEKLVDHKVTIPRFGQAESLNVAIATSIFCDNVKRHTFLNKKPRLIMGSIRQTLKKVGLNTFFFLLIGMIFLAKFFPDWGTENSPYLLKP